MGLEPTSGLAELLTNPDRIDRIFVDRATLEAEDRLKVLVSECELASEQSFEPVAVERLMSHLRSRYHFILQDVNRAPTAVAMAVLKKSDVRVLVLEPTLAAARDAARILKNFADDEETRKVLMVLSRTRPRRSGDLPVTKIEKFIGRPIDVFIPFDKKRLSVASLNAEPVARQKSAVTDAYQKLAGELLGQKVTARRSGWLSRAFGG